MTFDTLLIPTDGSDPSETAARRGFALANALGASVHVLSVADSALSTGVGYSGDSPSIRKRLREAAHARVTSLSDEAGERGLHATAAVRDGIPAKEIVDYADEHAMDAIVIGTAGRGGVARAIVGSVADKVVRTASVPVVTITPEAAETNTAASSIDSVLLPTDGSEPASAAIRQALVLTAQLEATVHFLSVVDSEIARVLSADDDGTERSRRIHEQAETYLDGLAADVRDRDLDVVTATADGTPATEILDYTAANDIDLIAMGTHGRGGFERLVVGSVTDTVIRRSSVPVFTVRPHSIDTETAPGTPDDDVRN